MKNIFLILSLTISTFIHAQLAEVRRQPYTFTHNYSAVATDNYIFFDENECDNIAQFCDIRQIIKTDHSLTVIDSLDLTNVITKGAGDYVFINDFVVGPNGNIFGALIRFNLANCVVVETFLLELTENLQLVRNTKIQTLDSLDFEARKIIVSDSLLLLVGMTSPYCLNGEYGGTIIEVDLLGNVLKSGNIDKTNLWNTDRFAIIFDARKFGNKYLASIGQYFIEFNDSLEYVNYHFAQPFPAPYGIGNIRRTAQFVDSPDALPTFCSFLTLDKDVWQITPTTNAQIRTVSMLKMDMNFTTTQLDTFSFTHDSLLPNEAFIPHLGLGGISHTNFDSIKIFISDYLVLGDELGAEHENTIYIYNINGNTKQLNWRRLYKTGWSVSPQKIVALPGNKTLLALGEFNFVANPISHQSTHWMVLDENGNLPGLSLEESFAIAPKLYPNPTAEYLRVEGLVPSAYYNYYFTSTSGQEVLRGKLHGEESISVKELPVGTYVFTITNEKGWGWTKTVVVQR
ncbi:MAG: T9SS type A sorting domain-containing protein [Schleiferiaceae bacterium]|nr:T9SS type A sorting domain-containing protein [Schleiferiaceae bacterium]